MRDYKIIPIDGQTWQIEDCFHDLMYLLEGEESAILIDAGIGIPGLKEVVQTLTHKPRCDLQPRPSGSYRRNP